MMVTNVLYAPRESKVREEGVRILDDSRIGYRVLDWAPDDPERCENVYLVSSLGEFAGLEGLRFYVGHYSLLRTVAVRRKFRTLARQWLSETKYCATVHERTQHPAFREIVKIGEAAVPLLLEELRNRPEHWFWALAEITGQNPATDSTCGNVESICEAWLEWGRKKGYLS